MSRQYMSRASCSDTPGPMNCFHCSPGGCFSTSSINGNHPFLSMPNVLCTPHLGWAEWQNFELYFHETFEQIVALEKGRPLRLRNPDVPPRARA
jgi:phosphoglycerate dehydrogenase-like enzyme